MPVIYDSEGRAHTVTDEKAATLVQGGDYTLEPGERVTVRNVLGGTTSVDTRLLRSQASSLTPYTSEEQARDIRQDRLEKEHDTVGSKVRATVGGAADALSLGFINPWRDDREFHPVYGGVGKVGGIAATLLIPGAGEANLARAGTEAAVEGAAVARGAGLLGRAGEAIGSAVGRTPLGLATRLGERVGGLIEGAGVGSRILRTAVNAGTAGGAINLGTELSRQLLDSDADFSGENLLGETLKGIGLGAGVGALGSAASEGITALVSKGKGLLSKAGSKASRASEATDDAALLQRTESRAPTPYDEAADLTPGGRPPLAPMLDTRNVTLYDGVTSRSRDLESLSKQLEALSEAPVLARKAGLTPRYIQEAQGTVERELMGLRSLSKFEDAPLARLAEDAHANDILGARLSQVSERVPARWSDAEVRTQSLIDRDRALDALAAKRARGLPVSQAEEDAVRYSAQLSAGRPEAAPAIRESLLGNAARGIINRLPGGKLVTQGLGVATGIGIAEQVISHGIGSIVTGAALPIAGGLLAGKAVQMAFRDPRIGGLIAANVPSVLNSTGVLRDGPRPTSGDPRRALRELADRSRMITPAQASSAAASSLSHAASSSPLAVSAAGQAAARRHAALLELLDRADPRPNGTQSLTGRPLPSAASARTVADFVRVANSPTSFVIAAAQGRLTPGMMSAAERLWPATVRRARAELTSLLSTHQGDLSPSQRRTIETILGRNTGSGQRSLAYATAMQASVARDSASIGSPGGGPSPGTVRTVPPAPTPADQAANPGSYR